MARPSREVFCARMGPELIARRSTGNFSAARYAHFFMECHRLHPYC